MTNLICNKICIIGIGHIGSSLARGIKQLGLARHVAVADQNPQHLATARQLGLADSTDTDITAMVDEADLILLCTPVGTFGGIMQAIAPHVKHGAIISDVGSVKQYVIDSIMPHMPTHASFVPGHPVAGTQFNGPESGLADLFQNHWCILTPTAATPLPALDVVQRLWRALGADVTTMDAQHHDEVLAITSHLPHLIAFSIVNTATDMGDYMQSEVLQYSAGGFRSFTRTAASDPTMWRDIFLSNREAVLNQLHLLQEDLAVLTRAIRWGDGDLLLEKFSRARATRQQLPDKPGKQG